MSHFNAWANPSKASAGEAAQMAAFLEERSRVPDALAVNRKLCELVAAKPGERLLEVGSGSGVLCRMLTDDVQPAGCVTGVDISPEMTVEARKYALAEEIKDGITFETANAEALPYPEASFDGALAARLLLHVPEPEAVIREMVRVVKPGGRVLVMDWDFETVTVDHPNRELTRRILHWRNDQHGGNNWSGRQLWRLMQAAGLQNLAAQPWVSVAHGEAEGLTQSLWRAAQVACKGGAILQAEQDAWVQELKERIQAGTFFASIVYFIVQGIVVSNQEGGYSMGYSVGIGLTNDCNLSCAHCYRDTERISSLSLEQVQRICEVIPVTSMGLGTGENALHPEFIPIVEYLRGRGIRLSIASNGYSLTSIPEQTLSAFHDVEVSIDYPTQPEQDAWRGAGNWALVHQAIERCHKLGIEVSILATMLRTNYEKMDRMLALARQDGVNLRVNAYQAVKTDTYRLKYDEFWEGYRRLFAEGLVVACSEPVVRAVMGLGEVHSPCGRNSIRFNPRGQVIPCVYWPTGDGALPVLNDLYRLGSQVVENGWFASARETPLSAVDCPCQGGCASRRALNGKLDAHDDYCPWSRDEQIQLPWHSAPAKDLMRAGNVCTTIVV